jgi:guanylate cyclase soluble subunit beta
VAAWDAISGAAGVAGKDWLSACPYDDGDTYGLVVAAAGALGVSAAVVLEAFGAFFASTWLRAAGFGLLMDCLGSNFHDFVRNLNFLHQHLAVSYEAMAAPSFDVERLSPTVLVIHYYSARPLLWSLVVGILTGVARAHWNHGIECRLLRGKDDGSCDHDVIEVTLPPEAAMAEDAAVARWRRRSDFVRASAHSLEPGLFARLFPFHMVLSDDGLAVLSTGDVLRRVLPAVKDGDAFTAHFEVRGRRARARWPADASAAADSAAANLREEFSF